MKKGAVVLLAALAAFLLTVSAYFLGRNSVRGVKVRTEQAISVQTEAVRSVPKQTELERVNINEASAEELQKLPQIGETLARRIVDYRTKNGPFSGISELMNVEGIGEARFEAIKDYITVR